MQTTLRTLVPVRRLMLLSGLAVLAATRPAFAAGEAMELQATGVQIYACEAAEAGFAWKFKAPEATLTGYGPEPVRHFAGPSWQAPDGSTVVGEVIAASPAPQPDAIPWLLLRAKSHAGAGAFATVGFITRTRTEGGAAPSGGCDAAHAGEERRVPYRAAYVLFPSPPQR